MRGRLPALALLLLLAGPGAASLWPQQGGPEHGNRSQHVGELDVVAIHRFLPEGDTLNSPAGGTGIVGPLLVDTPQGLAGIGPGALVSGPFGSSKACQVVYVHDLASGATSNQSLPDCFATWPLTQGWGGVLAFEQRLGLLLVCAGAANDSDPLLRALDAQGNVVWSVAPAQVLALARSSSGGLQGNLWQCGAGHLDLARDRLIVPVHRTAPQDAVQGLLAIDLAAGDVAWSRVLQPQDVLAGRFLPGSFDAVPLGPLRLHAVTGVEAGYVATGTIGYTQTLLVWLDADGNLNGNAQPGLDRALAGSPTRVAEPSAMSEWAVAVLGRLAVVAGDEFLLIDPEVTAVNGVDRIPLPASPGSGQLPAPAVAEERVYAAHGLGQFVSAIDSLALALNWTVDLGDWQAKRLFTQEDLVHVVATRQEGDARSAGLLSLHGATGRLVREVGLPFQVYDGVTLEDVLGMPLPDAPQEVPSQILPVFPVANASGVYLASQDGLAVLLGQAPADLAPAVNASQQATATGGIVVRLTGQGGAARDVYWGDGGVESWTEGEVRHEYTTPGPHTVRVVALLDGGRTATTRLCVGDCGGEPPAVMLGPERSPWTLRTAFARENQDITFGVLGLLITLVGAVVALVTQRRRRRTMARWLAELDRIRALPRGVTAALAHFETTINDAVVQGDLEDVQAALLFAKLAEARTLARASPS